MPAQLLLFSACWVHDDDDDDDDAKENRRASHVLVVCYVCALIKRIRKILDFFSQPRMSYLGDI